jgi:hypothetical protein
VILKSWGLCHLKANDSSYSRKFESLHLHAQIKFYGISKFTDQAKSSDLPGTGRNSADSAQICRRRAGERFQMAGRRGLAVSASGRPNWYAPISAVRSSEDRRRSFVVSATEMRASARVRVWLGVHRSSPRAARRQSSGGIRLRSVGRGRRCRQRCERRSGTVLGLLLHLQTLRRGQRWRRLPSVLALEKYSVSTTGSLGSQREGGERLAASQVTATFPFSSSASVALRRAR